MFGPGGMPRSKHQAALDDMLTSSVETSLPGGRTNTMASLGGNSNSGRRSSGKSNLFSGWRRKNSNGGGGMEDDGYMGDELIDDPMAVATPQNQDMNSLKSLRDRDRYPTLSSTSNKDRSMSITSMSSGFDTAPIIPTFKSEGNQQNAQYRKNIANSRKNMMRPPPGAMPPGPGPGPGGPLPPPGPPNGFGPPRRGPPMRPPSRNSPDSRLQSMSEHPDEYNMRPPPPTSPRAMSMTGRNSPYNSPPMGRFSGGPPPRRVSMVSKAVMTDPPPIEPSGSGSRGSISSVPETHTTSTANGLVTPDSTDNGKREVGEGALNSELANMNKNLLDEINVVTNELADAVRRELGLEPKETGPDDHTASHLVRLQNQLDIERRKRLLAESHVSGDDSLKSLHCTYKEAELEREVAERDRELQNEKNESAQLRESMDTLTQKFEALQEETNQLKNGILPELRSHVEDLEVLTATGNPIELVKQLDELKVENVKLQKLVEEQSTRGPLGEKIKSVEAQRDALREAFRSLREKKDHELRQNCERIRQLELRLDKERVINSQIQRKIVQTGNSSRSISTPALNNNNSSSSTSSPSTSPVDTTIPLPKRRGLTVPGIIPPSPLNATETTSRPNTPSPISFEISQEPAWLDYVDPSKLPPQHQRQASDRSTASLSLPNGRSEALPLSLSNS